MLSRLKELLQNAQLHSHKLLYNQFIEIHIDKEDIKKYISFLKTNHNLSFNILSDLFAADFPSRKNRFEIVYNLFSLKLNERILIKTQIKDKDKLISINAIHSCATWYEREIYDLFGIKFDDSVDMRRLLTDYQFIGHPLRKDFPLTGYVQVKYDSKLEKVIYEPVKLDQEYRDFDLMSPWQKNPLSKS